MRNVLLPTDFSVASLELAGMAVQYVKNQELNILLFHAFEMPFADSEIAGSRDKLPYQNMVTEAFRNACKQLKQKYPKNIRSIAIRHLYGNTAAVFRNFLDANDIDVIVCPDNYVFNRVHPQSVDPRPLFRKGGIPLLKDLSTRARTAEQDASLLQPGELSAKELLAIVQNEITLKEGEVYAAKKQYSAGLHLRENKE